MDVLPDNLLLHIFSSLPRQSLCLGVRMTCTRWRALSEDCSLWRIVRIPNHFSDQRMLLLLSHISEYVEELDIGSSNCLTEAGLIELSKLEMPHLKKISVPISLLLPDEFYVGLAKSCPRLQEVENIRTAYSGHCNPLLSQKEMANLTVIHDRPVATFGRMRGNASQVDSSKRSKWTDSLSQVSSTCKDVRSYRSNRGLEYINADGLHSVSKTFPFLNSLELHSCTITDEGLQRFFSANQSPGGLKEIIFDKPGAITDQGLATIADNCSELAYIKLARCSRITNKGIQYLVSKCRNLTDVHINNAPGFFEDYSDEAMTKEDITDSTIAEVATSCPKLTFFRLFHTSQLMYKGINSLVSGCPYLVGMMLFECGQISDTGLNELLQARFLKNLILVYCDTVTPAGLTDFILKSPSLNRLTFYTKNLDFCGDMSKLAEDVFCKIDDETDSFRPNQVHKLALRGIGAGCLQLLTVLCPNLITLDMREAKYLTEHSMISVLKNCEFLEYLDISSMDDAGDNFLEAVCEYGGNIRVLTLGTSVSRMSTVALTKVIKTCVSLNTLEMEMMLGEREEELVEAVRHYHGGWCYLYIESEDEDEDEEAVDPAPKQRYIELHFTPIKYLDSITQNAVTTN